MSEVDKRCIYASSEHLKMINSFISYGITEDKMSLFIIGLWDGVAKKAKPYFQMRARAYRLVCGAPIANQDFVCLLWGEGERRYELLSMIEQSDIIRATSLPNATSSVNATLLSNASERIGWCGGPQSKPRFICLLWGEAEVRVAQSGYPK